MPVSGKLRRLTLPFHDDDLMEPDFVKEMRLASTHYPQAVAIGGNAWVIQLSNGFVKAAFLEWGDFRKYRAPHRLFERYFGRHQNRYCAVSKLRLPDTALPKPKHADKRGQYADVELCSPSPLKA